MPALPRVRDGCADGINHFLAGRHYSQRGKRSAVDYGVIIDEHRVLAVVSVNELDIDPKIPPNLRRRTDSV
ncbi:MAG: hypothetical protein ACJ79Q_06810 [Gemmatimonadaceae bacterium]|jgi:hypothetical protein